MKSKKHAEMCRWFEDDDGNWHTDCDEIHVLIDGGPADNHMRFCCYCGAKLKEVRVGSAQAGKGE